MSQRQHQPRLFDTDAPPWEVDDATEALVATVVLGEAPWGPFDYRTPDALRGAVEPGRRVRVPLGRGNRALIGYCVRVEPQVSQRPLKDIAAVVDDAPLLSPAMLRLTEWMAREYQCPWGQALQTVIPAGVRVQAGTRDTPLLSVAPETAARLHDLKLAPKQAAALQKLAASPKPLTSQQLAHLAGCTTAPIQALRKAGLIEVRRERLPRHSAPEPAAPRENHHDLHAEQQQAFATIVDAMRSREHRTILLHGVTGSGKTEVYIRSIEEAISYGRQAIVLVPEISLTPQTQQRFRSRFDSVAVLHSHQTDVERHFQWKRIARGDVQVVVGARSAVFAPTPQLGLIVLDEEHDGSFKQDSAPRYHAREVALRRAAAAAVPLVLGSATPSLESWQAALEGRYQLVDMPRRVLDLPLPAVGVIDLRSEFRSSFARGAISRPLQQAIEQSLAAGGQVILLLNRRGYSTHIQCPACGHVVKCPDCDIALTHHRHVEQVLCHYCDYQQPSPPVCPECKFQGIRYTGLGTQRLEAEVKARFPGAACLRMDSDTMRRPGSHEQALGKFRAGEVQILLGTQMIAKGLDFPNVTLVGVINADTALHLPDFRAAERTFQLVTQVAGRTGRGAKGGRVLVQTFAPEHPAIEAAVRHDYHRFAAHELPTRREYRYPPFSHLARLIVRGPDEKQVEATASALVDRLTAAAAAASVEIRVLGPAPAPIARLRGLFRFHVLASATDREAFHEAIRRATADLPTPDDVQWIVDIDPLEML